jgi:hypothetical protein
VRLSLHFAVNLQRIKPSDVASLRQRQRELVSVVASVAYLQCAVKEDPELADFLAAGEVIEHLRLFEPSPHVRGQYGSEEWFWVHKLTTGTIQTARDICWIADWDGWMWGRWSIKTHSTLFQTHSRTQSFPSGHITVVTRMTLPDGVNQQCVSTMRAIIREVWFKARRPIVDLYDRQDPMLLRVQQAVNLQFTAGLIRDGIQRSVAYEASRLEPVTGRQDPDGGCGPGVLDPEMVVRLSHADCSLDNEVRQSDAEIGIDRW